jgi:hypothetical protein
MAEFEENNIERKMAPSVDYYTEQVNNLPEEIGQNLKTTLAAYKEVSEKGWNGSQWTAGLRTRAKQLERELQGQLRAINSQIATSEYFEAKREERATKEQIKKIQLKLDAPMDSSYIIEGRRHVNSFFKQEDRTDELVLQYAREYYDRDRRKWLQELASLTGEEPVEEEVEELEKGSFVVVGGENTTVAMFKESVSKLGEEETIRRLKKRGATEADINFLRGGKAPEPTEREKRMEALGTRDERVSALGRGFVARTDALGSRAERMKALGSREERTSSLFN